MKKTPKQKKCRICKEPFTPWSTTQIACSGKCAIEHTRLKNERKYKQRTRELRRQQNDRDRGYQIRMAQKWFNRYIRLRDRAEPCISCGRHHQGQYHAGHYRTTKACSQRRFCEYNTNKQCKPCNVDLSGNIGEYRIRLVQKYGLAVVEEIECDNRVVKISIDELRRIQSTYKAKCAEIEKQIQ